MGLGLRVLSTANKASPVVPSPVDLNGPPVARPSGPTPTALPGKAKALAEETLNTARSVSDTVTISLRNLVDQLGPDLGDRLAPVTPAGNPPDGPWLENRARDQGSAREPRDAQSPPTPNKEPRPWVITPERTSKEMTHPRFGRFSQHSSSELWWTQDRAGHGGSVWKVYREINGQLQWEADTDAIGNYLPKHKGPTGKTISMKEFRGIR